MLAEADLAALAGAIAKLLPRAPLIDDDLWSVAEIAAYLKRSPAVVRDRVVCLPRFPAAIRIPVLGGKGKGQPLWKSEEVRDWASYYQERRR